MVTRKSRECGGAKTAQPLESQSEESLLFKSSIEDYLNTSTVDIRLTLTLFGFAKGNIETSAIALLLVKVIMDYKSRKVQTMLLLVSP